MTSSAREQFAQRLDALYSAAGAPPLKAVGSRATRELRARNPRGREISAQRISDWRLGRNVPAKFDGLSAVLGVLIAAARKRDATPTDPSLYSMPGWHRLWTAAGQKKPSDQPATPDVCPYPGLAALTIDDAEFFAGRDKHVDLMRVRLTGDGGTHEPLILVGDSGVGKSSLLQAGFAAQVRDEFDVLLVTPGLVAADELVRWATERASPDKPFILAVEQLEELFLPSSDAAAVDRYLDVLGELAASGGGPGRCTGVVAVLRADFYTEAARHPALAALLETNQMLLGPPSAEELTAAIVEPAARAGLRVGEGLVELILTDLDVRGSGADATIPPGTFPLLAHALHSAWRYRDDDGMSVRAYERAGGVRGAVAASAERCWASFSSSEQDIARIILLQLVVPTREGSAVGRHVDRDTLIGSCPDQASAESVLGALVDARIITQDAYGTSLAHDTVITVWPRLAHWVDDDRENALIRHRLQVDADDWVSSGRDRSLLYRGTRLTVANDLRSTIAGSVTRQAGEFLDAATRLLRRTTYAKRGLIAFLVVGALVTSLLAVVSMRQSERADRESADAQFAALIAAARHDQSSDSTESAQLALVANDERPDDRQAQGLLLASQSAPLAATFRAQVGAIYGAARSRNGLIATGGYDNAVQLWRADTERGLVPVGSVLSTSSWVSSVAFSPDGQTLFAGTGTGVVQRWNVADPAHAVRGDDIDLGHRGAVYSVAVRGDGRIVATAGDDGTVRLQDLMSGHTVTLTGHAGPVRAVTFTPDGTTAVSGGDDGTARIWDVTEPAAAHEIGAPLTGQTLGIHSLAVSPDGTMLATGSDDQTFRLWSIRDRDHVVASGPPVQARAAAVWSLAFAPDNRTLVTSGRDGAASLWSLADPRHPVPVGMPMNSGSGGLGAVLFLDDGRVLTGGQSGTIQLWTLPPGVLAGHTDLIVAPAFDADGKLMVTGSWDGRVLLWDTSGAVPHVVSTLLPLDGSGPRIENVALARDGRTVAVTRSGTKDVLLFDVSSPDDPVLSATLPIPDANYSTSLAFTPDSMQLATAFDDVSVQLWDLHDPHHPTRRPDIFTGPSGWINGLRFAPDGSHLFAVSSAGRLHEWNVRGGPTTSTVLASHPGALNAVDVSRDGTSIAIGGDDQVIRLLRRDGDTATEVGEIRGHSGPVRSVAFDPTSAVLASGSDDQTVRLWTVDDLRSPRSIGTSLVPPGTVQWRVAFNSSGMLAAAGEDAALRWLTTDVHVAARRVCSTTSGTGLTPEWQRWDDELSHACAD
ncbi:hypothetical protein AAFP35_10765 [Gordonia sp. CPCC 206044]|uniref:nSTAND1 domain-containing NTPase n=1 Tax=Gordonia sp. CPCC 206044 TaxID=3140793 RepID=UPI003AF40743